MKKQIIILAFLVFVTPAVFGQMQTTTTNQTPTDADQRLSYDQNPGDLYRGNEFSIDAFGSDALGKYAIEHPSGRRISHSSRLGVGMGLNYFFTRYVGIGGEAITEDASHSFVNEASGSVIVRIPIGQTGVAPYAFGGGGHQWGPINANFGHAGIGVEYRFTRNVALFVDGRGVWTDKTKDNALVRTGFRFAF